MSFVYISGTSTFTPEDAFVGYQSDTPASIVFKVWQYLELSNVELSEDNEQWEEEVMLCTYLNLIVCHTFCGV